MAKWQRTLNIADVWQGADRGEITLQHLCTTIANRLQSLTPFPHQAIEEMRRDLIDDFQSLAEDDDLSEDEVNYAYDSLCDWGDLKLDDDWNGARVCWIKTF